MTHSFPLSAEQQNFISIAQTGKNVLVDACIGSGKTTAIQRLCDELPKSRRILYLTYNRLLKIDARSRIASANTAVTNYHGFAYGTLKRIGINPGISDLIHAFIEAKPPFPPYDVLIIDEYQDIEQEFADIGGFHSPLSRRLRTADVYSVLPSVPRPRRHARKGMEEAYRRRESKLYSRGNEPLAG